MGTKPAPQHDWPHCDSVYINSDNIAYLIEFKKMYEWGFSMPMMYAGLYGVHVFATAYLKDKPNVSSYDLKCMFEMLDKNKKKRYDYDYLDSVYEQYMKNKVIK